MVDRASGATATCATAWKGHFGSSTLPTGDSTNAVPRGPDRDRRVTRRALNHRRGVAALPVRPEDGHVWVSLAPNLRQEQVKVVEVMRPKRYVRRRHGTSDVVDAIAAARAALSGEANATPKTHDGSWRRCGA